MPSRISSARHTIDLTAITASQWKESPWFLKTHSLPLTSRLAKYVFVFNWDVVGKRLMLLHCKFQTWKRLYWCTTTSRWRWRPILALRSPPFVMFTAGACRRRGQWGSGPWPSNWHCGSTPTLSWQKCWPLGACCLADQWSINVHVERKSCWDRGGIYFE